MNAMTTLIFLLVATGQQSTEGTHNDQAAKAKSQRLLELHTDDAASFSIYRDPKRTEKLELRREPAYRWTNPTRVGGQIGEVFLWTYRGRPEVVGSIFSHPTEDGRLYLPRAALAVAGGARGGPRASEQWVPQAAGVSLKVVEGAPPPGTAAQRLRQMRHVPRVHRKEHERPGPDVGAALLPQPLYRYESSDPDVVDGPFLPWFRRPAPTLKSSSCLRPASPNPIRSGFLASPVFGHEPLAQSQKQGSLELDPFRGKHILPRRQAHVSLLPGPVHPRDP